MIHICMLACMQTYTHRYMLTCMHACMIMHARHATSMRALLVEGRTKMPGHAYVDYDDEGFANQLADAKCDAKKDPFRGWAI